MTQNSFLYAYNDKEKINIVFVKATRLLENYSLYKEESLVLFCLWQVKYSMVGIKYNLLGSLELVLKIICISVYSLLYYLIWNTTYKNPKAHCNVYNPSNIKTDTFYLECVKCLPPYLKVTGMSWLSIETTNLTANRWHWKYSKHILYLFQSTEFDDLWK